MSHPTSSTILSKASPACRSLLGLGLILGLSACVSLQGPPPKVQAGIPPQYSNRIAGTSIAAQGYQDFFADPRLLQVMKLALANNRDLRSASLNIQRVQQQYQISSNAQLPTIAASGSAIRQLNPASNPNNPYASFQVGLGLSAYELDVWGRIRSLKDAALDNYLASQSGRDAVQISLVSQVAQAWLSHAFAAASLTVAEQTLNSQLEAYNLNQQRFAAGIDSKVPLRQAQISVETARHDIASYKTQMAQAHNLLNLLAGETISPSLLAIQPPDSITRETVFSTGLSSDLLNNRPDLKAAQYQLAAAGANIGAAKARLFPSISLTGSAGYASAALGDLFKSGSFNWSLGPAIDLPLLDWGTRQAAVSIAKTEQQIAVSDYEKAIQVAFREVNDALATRTFIDQRLTAQQRLLQASSSSYQLSEARFRAGIDSYMSVLDAQRSTYAAQQGLLLLQQARLNNQIELYKVLGGGLSNTPP